MFGQKKNEAVWIRRSHLLQADEFICSACGFRAKKAHKSCPHCGVRIEKVKADTGWADEAFLFDLFGED